MNNPSILKILLLGPVEIYSNGERLKLPRRIERVLLYYLAIENRPVSRSTLIDLLWPEADHVDPRATLRTALSRLRKTLPDPGLLITDLDQVALDTGRCFIDLQKFRTSYMSIRGVLSALPDHKPLPVPIVNQIKEALALWRGDRVIQGEILSSYQALEHWWQHLSRTLTLQREYMTRRLAAHYQFSGQLEMALDLYLDLGRMNTQDIAAHLAVIEILTKLGRHLEALEFCDALEVIFEREYGAPLPEDIIKYCQTAQQMSALDSDQFRPDWPLRSAMDLSLVGRGNELRQLRQAYHRGGVVIIQGMMGIGKSRLVQEFYEMLTPKPILLMAVVRENERILPLAPIIDAFRRNLPEKIWHDIDLVWANQLTLLFPELVEKRADCSFSNGDVFPSARQHLFDAIHHLLTLVARSYGKVLFFLDDAHWADHQTLQVFLYLVSVGFFDQNGLLIITKENAYTNAEMDEFVNQVHHNHRVQLIDLPGLNPDELRILIEQTLNRPPSTGFVDRLYRETQGNPFLALEFLHYVLEHQLDVEDLKIADQLPMPDSIQMLVRSRLNTFSADARLILACAAVIESDITLKMLQVVSGIVENEFLNALNPLIKHGFFRINQPNATNSGMIAFAHKKVREVVLDEATPTYVQILHQRVARYLSQDEQSMEKAAVIADHYQAGGDHQNALTWYIKAAEHAWILGASEDVLRNFQQADCLITTMPGDWIKLNDVLALYKKWWDYAYQSYQVDMMEEIGIKLQSFLGLGSESHVMGLSNMVLANACFMREDYETALVLVNSAIKQLESADDCQALIQAHFHQGLICWWTLDFEGVLQSSTNMLEAINDSRLPAEESISNTFNALRLITETYHIQGNAKQAVESAQRTFREFFHQLDTFDRLRAYNMMALSHFSAGDIDESIRFSSEGLETVHKFDNTLFEGLLLISLCKAEISRGLLDEAYQHGLQALEFAEHNHRIQSIIAANTMLGDIFNILHNTSQAIQHYRIAQVRQGYTFQSYYGLLNGLHLSRLLTRSGQYDEAGEILSAILTETDRKGLLHLHAQALLADGLLDIQIEDFSEAEGKFSLALAIAEQNGLKHEAIWAKFRMAYYQFTMKRYAEAADLLTEVLSATKVLGMPVLNLQAFELAWELSAHTAIHLEPDELRTNFLSLAAKFEAHTQSKDLKPEFEKVQRYWRERGYYP